MCSIEYGASFKWMQSHMATNGEIEQHEQTYSGFTALLKWGTIASFVIAVIVVFLIAG